jgi:SagB-type dehydrogenase family enzyme
MSSPHNIDSGQSYHHATCYDRQRMTPHYLDWSNVPLQSKPYTSLTATNLIPVEAFPDTSLRRLTENPDSIPSRAMMDLRMLSQVLMLAYGFTAKQKTGGQIYRYRSVPSAGALYPAEIYLAWPGLSDLKQGLYYYDIHEFLVKSLRNEDPSATLQKALALKAPHTRQISFLLSGIFFRSAWKYRKRAFRYVMLDIGHLIETLYFSLRLFGISCSIHYDFDDELLCRLAGLDGKREACFACMNWRVDHMTPSSGITEPAGNLLPLSEAHQRASQVAGKEVYYNEIEDIYRISLQTPSATTPSAAGAQVVDREPNEWFKILETNKSTGLEMPFAETVRRRRSRRNFTNSPFPTQSFMQLLEMLRASPAKDMGEGDGLDSYLKIGFIAGNIAGLDPGFYMLSRAKGAYGLVRAGDLSQKMANVCLDQQWLKLASVHFLFMADLKAVDIKFGARGYRKVMMNAGRLGQRLYLGATALDAGCCGIGALYDIEARNLLSLKDDSALLYLVAVGQLKGERFQASR